MAEAKNNLENLEPLAEMQLPGEATVNPMIAWMKGLSVENEFLTLSPNSFGSIGIDLDFPLLAKRILALIPHLYFEFKGTLVGGASNSTILKVAGGHVYMPRHIYSLNAYQRTLSAGDNDKTLMITLTASGAAYSFGELPSTMENLTDASFTLPILTVYKDAGAWEVLHHHVGAFVFTIPPAPLIGGFDNSAQQTLDHPAGGSFAWVSYGDCQGNAIGG